MKLIIDIDDEVFQRVKETETIQTTDFEIVSLYRAVKNSIPIKENAWSEFLSALMQMVMTPEQLNEVFQNMVMQKQSSWRDQMKEHFREAAENGDTFHLHEIENIIDGEVLE